MEGLLRIHWIKRSIQQYSIQWSIAEVAMTMWVLWCPVCQSS